MAINGFHAIVYTPEPEAARAVLRDVLGFDHVDAGEGWLLFKMPPAELGVHPSDGASHEVAFMCDDLAATMAELADKGITFKGEVQQAGFGSMTRMELPGGLDVMLYQPRHPLAHDA